jgi:hypothetical protein
MNLEMAKTGILSLAICILASGRAEGSESVESAPAIDRTNTFEVSPFLGQDIYGPGINGQDQTVFGLAWEKSLDSYSVVLGLTAAGFHGEEKSVGADYWSSAKGGGAFRVGGGLRHYFSVRQSADKLESQALYTGFQLRYGQQNTFFEHESNDGLDISEYAQELDSILEGGFRLQVREKLTFRLGVALKGRRIVSRQFDGNERNPKMANEIEAVHDNFVAPFADFGVGVMF